MLKLIYFKKPRSLTYFNTWFLLNCMTTQLGKQSAECLHSIDDTIEKWLKERQALLVLYNQLLESPLLQASNTDTATLTRFCEALIDYVSLGHFRVFEKIAEVEAIGKNDIGNYSVTDIIYSQNVPKKQEDDHEDSNIIVNILRTTLQVLDFNDKYAENAGKNLIDLKEDLSSLGENLADRLDWEDELVSNYLRVAEKVRSERTDQKPKASA